MGGSFEGRRRFARAARRRVRPAANFYPRRELFGNQSSRIDIPVGTSSCDEAFPWGGSVLMGTNELSCDDVFARLDDYLDRELSAAEMDAVRVHLDRCAECASEYAFEGRVLGDLRAKLRRVRIPERFSETIIGNLTKEILDERS